MKSDLSAPNTYTSSQRLNALGYKWMQKHIGVDRCLELLRRIHCDDETSDGLVLQGDNSALCITNSFLLSHLPYIKFGGDQTLHVYHAKMVINVDQTAQYIHPQVDYLC